MKNSSLIIIAAVSLLSVRAEGQSNPKLQSVKMETHSERLIRIMKLEKEVEGKVIPKNPAFTRMANASNQSTNSIQYSNLGQSINPYSTFSAGRNCLSVVPSQNVVSFFRRGGPTDPGGLTSSPGNKIFYDYNIQGGTNGFWQLTQGPVYKDDNYINLPNHTSQGGSSNYGARYPQGALFNPAGNSSINNIVALALTRVQDGSNSIWGGLGTGWQKLSASGAQMQELESSIDPLHFRQESLEVTANAVYATEPIEDVSSGAVVFTDRIAIYKYSYNSATNSFAKTNIFLPFANQGGLFATVVNNTAIAFSPDGQTGYVVVTAANNSFDSVASYIPYFSKTTNGGDTWTTLQPIRINKKKTDGPNTGLDVFRDKMLSNLVYFNANGNLIKATYADATNHKLHYVDYLVNDVDLVVDNNNGAHIFTSICVSGFGDTLNATFQGGVTYYPGYGAWNMHFYLNDVNGTVKGELINQNSGLNGCWGDCAGTDNFKDANRPQAARSEDGTTIAFAWYDTDISAHQQLTSDNNSNPDLWVQRIKVTGAGQFYYGPRTRNITKGSIYDGMAALGNVAPRLLNNPSGGYFLPSTIASFADYNPSIGTGGMTTQHLYVGNVSIPSAIDSFPVPFSGTPLNVNLTIDSLQSMEKNIILPGRSLKVYVNSIGIPEGSRVYAYLSNESGYFNLGTTDTASGNFIPGFVSDSVLLQSGKGVLNVKIPENAISGCRYSIMVRYLKTGANGYDLSAKSKTFGVGSLLLQKFDQALSFNGTSGYADFGSWFAEDDFTISFWVKPDSNQTGLAAIIDIQNDLALYSNPSVPGNYVLAHLLQTDLIRNNWNHVTITVNRATNTRKVYLFGYEIASNNWTYNPVAGYRLKLGGGSQSFFNGFFRGQIDDLKIWNYNLTNSEILAQVSKPLQGNENGLLAYYDFNETNCGNIIQDLTGNGHSGILISGATRIPSTLIFNGCRMVPSKIGNEGTARIVIYDKLLPMNPIVKIKKTGQPDQIADTAFVNSDRDKLTFLWNIPQGQPNGIYSVEISGSNGQVRTYPDSLSLEPADSTGSILFNIIGKNAVRPGRVTKLMIVYQLTGNKSVKAPVFHLQSFENKRIAFSYRDLKYKFQDLPVLLGNRYGSDSNDIYKVDTLLSPGAIYAVPVFVDGNSGINFNGGRISVSPCEELSNFRAKGVFPRRKDFDGSRGQAKIPYKANDGLNYIDGCSNPQLIANLISQYVGTPPLQLINYNDLFLNACASHDLCYQTCYNSSVRPKAICDNEFLRDMANICMSQPPNIRDQCLYASSLYWMGVNTFGGSSFTANQDNCTGGSDEPSPSGSSTYFIPDCDNCPPGDICFSQKQINSFDPNNKIGPFKWQQSGSNFRYVINFENIDSATAPAQEVIILDTIDGTRLDLSTFSFGGLGFHQRFYANTAAEKNRFSTIIDLRPSKNLLVKAEGTFNAENRIATWRFSSLDPLTNEPIEDPFDGFLPPNDSTGKGEGYVYYSVSPFPTLLTGDSIRNNASIVFDANKPILTDTWLNIIDDKSPVSEIRTLPPIVSTDTIVLKIIGSDTISGIRKYRIYTSNDTTNFFLAGETSDTLFKFSPTEPNLYFFYSEAVDSAGNIQNSGKKIVGTASIITRNTLRRGDQIKLLQNFPNPFSSETTIEYYLDKPYDVKLTIHDLLGRQVAVFDEATGNQGLNQIVFQKNRLPRGSYFYTLSTSNHRVSKMMTIE